ncbi:hypothetical protein GX51_03759 [Blastomyces parvus]|uniref:Integrase catalytic domain-containing protein n=1 Tax=Blastomyces parvus TaxID=2060905 RepID=A0A2B7X562_9EURO|nr:hypothetical protein GX51_03759 [Blastomyces parvus]
MTEVQVRSHRPSYINALLIQSRGRPGLYACLACRNDRPGLHPFPECRKLLELSNSEHELGNKGALEDITSWHYPLCAINASHYNLWAQKLAHGLNCFEIWTFLMMKSIPNVGWSFYCVQITISASHFRELGVNVYAHLHGSQMPAGKLPAQSNLKPRRRGAGRIQSFEPMDLMGMDFLGPIRPLAEDSCQYVLVAVNYFTRFVWTNPYVDATEEAVVDFLYTSDVTFPAESARNAKDVTTTTTAEALTTIEADTTPATYVVEDSDV